MTTLTAMEKFVDFFTSMTPASVEQLHTVYTEDVFFKDPFNAVTGLSAVRKIFLEMFHQVDEPRFVVLLHGVTGSEGFITWEMHYRFKNETRQQCIRGATHVQFSADGRISLHRDYWDAAEELYEKLPILGSLMRMLKRAVQRRAAKAVS